MQNSGLCHLGDENVRGSPLVSKRSFAAGLRSLSGEYRSLRRRGRTGSRSLNDRWRPPPLFGSLTATDSVQA